MHGTQTKDRRKMCTKQNDGTEYHGSNLLKPAGTNRYNVHLYMTVDLDLDLVLIQAREYKNIRAYHLDALQTPERSKDTIQFDSLQLSCLFGRYVLLHVDLHVCWRQCSF